MAVSDYVRKRFEQAYGCTIEQYAMVHLPSNPDLTTLPSKEAFPRLNDARLADKKTLEILSKF